MRAPNRLSFKTAQWAFPVALTLHNLEEAWLPGFWQSRSWHLPISGTEFRIAVALIAILGYLLTYLSVRDGKKSLGAYIPGKLFCNHALERNLACRSVGLPADICSWRGHRSAVDVASDNLFA